MNFHHKKFVSGLFFQVLVPSAAKAINERCRMLIASASDFVFFLKEEPDSQVFTTHSIAFVRDFQHHKSRYINVPQMNASMASI